MLCKLLFVYPLQDKNKFKESEMFTAIPEVSLDEILGKNKLEIKLTVYRYEDGMLTVREAHALLSILVLENPKEVLEIGTFMGHTTKEMAENLKNSIIHTIDLPLDFSLHKYPAVSP